MTSLFHPTGPKGSSSDASSSANPFQALTHFYEQELTNLHIDSAPSRHYQQLPLSSPPAHLFPSALPSTSSPFSNSLVPGSKDRHGEEFKTFSHATRCLGGGSSSNINVNSSVDISQHLRQRQEYYLHEARLRSADRHDGLGPIVDFSQLWHQRQQQSEDHIVARHYNPYAEETRTEAKLEELNFRQHWRNQSRREFQQSQPASSQQEQVQMDLGQDASMDLEHTWQETLSAMSSSSSSPSSPSSPALTFAPMPMQSRQYGPAVEGSLASSFMDAAVALPSSWPLAPWAIETQAALMEFETIYKDYSPRQQLTHGQRGPHLHHQQQLEGREHQQPSWSEEFAKASCGVSPSTPAHSLDRRESLKTCGFMLDPKHQSLESFESLDDISSVQARLNAVVAATATAPPSQTSDNANTTAVAGHEASTIDLSLGDGFHPPMSTYPTTHQESMTNNLVSIERPGQSFNDDIFEGDMLQAWMETLAQEKQEADEAEVAASSTKSNNEEGEVSEADRQILETAIRRLNALKLQLDSRLPPPLPPSPRFDQEA